MSLGATDATTENHWQLHVELLGESDGRLSGLLVCRCPRSAIKESAFSAASFCGSHLGTPTTKWSKVINISWERAFIQMRSM